MKKILLILTILSTSLVFNSCRKDDNPKLPDLIRVPVPTFNLHEDSQELRIIDPDTYTSTFDFGLYFPDDVPPQKADIVVAMNGNLNDIKVLQGDITSFPVTVEVTAASLATAFGLTTANLAEGTTFELRARFTLRDGTVINPFNSTGLPYSSDVQNLPNISLTLKYEVPCALDISQFEGAFEVVTDEWQDYAAGDIVQVTLIDDTHLSFEYLTSDAQPIVVEIDPATFATSVASQYYGMYGSDRFSVESVPGRANALGTCDISISVRLHHTTATDDYGEYTIVLRKVVP